MSVADAHYSKNISTHIFDKNNIPQTTNVAIFATYKSNQAAIDDVCFYIENNLSDIIQLPELFFVEDKSLTQDGKTFTEIEKLSNSLVQQVSEVLRPFQYVCTSLIIKGAHQAVLINDKGLFATQKQINQCNRYLWTGLDHDIKITHLPLEQGNITICMLTGDDALDSDLVTKAASQGIHALLVPFDIQAPHDFELSFLTQAAANRICIVAASREKSYAIENASENNAMKRKPKQFKSTGLIINLPTETSLIKQISSGKVENQVDSLLVKHQQGKITKALLFPIAACYKVNQA